MRGVRWAAKPGSHSKRHWSAEICKILSMSSWQVNKNSQNLAWTTLYLYTQVPIDQKSQDSKSWKTRLDKIVRVCPRTTCQWLGCWRSRRSISRSANSQGGDKMFLVNRGSQKVTNTMLLEPWCPGSFNISQHPLWPEKKCFFVVRIKHSQVRSLGKFGPTALNFGYYFFLLDTFLGHLVFIVKRS